MYLYPINGAAHKARNHDTPVRIKAKCNPKHFFRVNQNIPPAA
jgi:hypothetical protein